MKPARPTPPGEYPAAPGYPAMHERATMRKRSSFLGAGCALQGLAFIVCALALWMILKDALYLQELRAFEKNGFLDHATANGLYVRKLLALSGFSLLGLVAVWLFFQGRRKAIWLECSLCGGRLAHKQVRICPHCRTMIRR